MTRARRMMLSGASVLAIVLASERAMALPLNGGWSNGGGSATNYAAQASQEAMKQQAQAAARSQEAMSRALAAMKNVTQFQAAARAIAIGKPAAVPDGLRPGGLVPAVNAPVLYTDDPTGKATWDGANMPTQTTSSSGQTEVTVEQTNPQAILSWSSFNVGRNTILDFNQQGHSDWTALNRVVAGTAPSQILGSIRSDGTVLVINHNGIIFGGGAQINVGSLVASTLDIGILKTTSTFQSNQFFLQPTTGNAALSYFGADQDGTRIGDVSVEAGAAIATTSAGQIILMGHHVTNAGSLSSPDGQVILAAGESIFFTKNTGDAQSADPNVRGLLTTVRLPGGISSWSPSSYYVNNTAGSVISAERGNITLATNTNISDDVSGIAEGGGILQAGVLEATTSVSRNGSIIIRGGDIEIAGTGVLSIGADTKGETIPQDPTSLGAFKPSEILIGGSAAGDSNVAMRSGAFVYAPSATVSIGSGGVTTVSDPINGGLGTPGTGTTGSGYVSSTFIDRGAVIDVAGIADVQVPVDRNEVTIAPVKGNELRDSPLLRAYLNGQTVYLDPRKSGVRADGVAWIGSPLIDAAAYYQLVGVGAAELMTKGGNVSIAGGAAGVSSTSPLGGVVIRPGATIDISGGWVTYAGGTVRESRLLDSSGRVVPIGNADPYDIYVGVYDGFKVDHARWGYVETYASVLTSDTHQVAGFIEGRDAGSLTINASTAALDETLRASSYAGLQQMIDSKRGTATGSTANDHRALQGAPSQLPSGGLLSITAGVDIGVTSQSSAPPASLTYGAPVVIAADGSYKAPTPQAGSASLTTSGSLQFLDRQTQGSGLAQLSLASSGTITVESDAKLILQPGGAFTASSGRQIDIEGSVTAAGGTIDLKTGNGGLGSLLSPDGVSIGSFDISVNGTLSVAGQWVNEYNVGPTISQSHAWLDGGTISMFAASNLLATSDGKITTGKDPDAPRQPVTDVSGSIIVNPRARLRLSGGGRVDQFGHLVLTSKGGNLSLLSATAYFQTLPPNGQVAPSSGFEVGNTIATGGGTEVVGPTLNPSQINAKITFDPRSIEASGFAGGGTFTLETPQITIGQGPSTLGTDLPLDFFSRSGFATFNITSNKTALLPSTFDNGYGGYDALLQTQTITVGAGQVLSLSQAMLPSYLDAGQSAALRQLRSGGDVMSVLQPFAPTDSFDQRAVSLNFGGLVELQVAAGGRIIGTPGSSLSAAKILNEGTIRIAGGTILQREVLPAFYGSGNGGVDAGSPQYIVPAIGVHSLGDVFTVGADGMIAVDAASKVPLFDQRSGTYTTQFVTNGDLAGNFASGAATPIYLLGRLDADQGIVLAKGSVTDLSGTVLTNPRAVFGGQPINSGGTVGGGTIATAPTTADFGTKYLGAYINHSWVAPRQFVAEAGATIDLSGVSAQFDFPAVAGKPLAARHPGRYGSWSDGGNLIASNGATLTGAIIDAHGGTAAANGGELDVLSPVLVAHDPSAPTANQISADMIEKAGFDSFVAIGSLSSSGDVTLNLRDRFILRGVAFDTADKRSYVFGSNGAGATASLVVPQVRNEGGRLEIDAGYVGLQSTIDRLDPVSQVAIGTPGDGSVVFNAGAIDVSGAVLFDRSVADATLSATGDLRLIGIEPWQLTYSFNASVPPALNGALAVNGNLDLVGNRIYPTTGSTFAVTSAASDGTITLGRSGTDSRGVPYSAGGNLSFAAAHIVDGGDVRVPFGTLTLGSSAPITGSVSGTLAPATKDVTLLPGSITGVSADGLTIPYGTTTDLKEWYFTPTSSAALTAPPAKVLQINATNITIQSGATVDISGGGDVYAYEFVAGTGGSHDVLSRFNGDPFSGNAGYQYPDQRQVYAIVPGLSDAPVAAYDPIYSSDYGAISRGSQIGERVYLDAAPGLSAGWYTLLPAQYAMLPGGMRVVEQTGATNVLPGISQQNPDGSLFVSGHYGNAVAGTSQSQVRLFSVEDRSTILEYSNIQLTSGNSIAAAAAAKANVPLPPIGLDAGRLVLNPSANLTIDAAIDTTAAPAGRGAGVDIGGRAFDIVSDLAQAPDDGAIHLTAGSLQNLHAESLLIGGFRTDNADGTTTLTVTAQSITVANDAAHPITAAEIILAVDDLYDNPAAARLTLNDGATLTATGNLSDTRNGAYIIDGTQRTVNPVSAAVTNPVDSGHGAVVRVANGPQRLVDRRIDPSNAAPEAVLDSGAATLSGTDLMLDSSDQNHLSSGLVFTNDQRIAVGAKSIGFGADPSTYAGLVITSALEQSLTGNGAALTLRSQTSIDFAGGTYTLGNVTFDSAALSSLDGRDVTIKGQTIGLGNIGAAADCKTCEGTGAHLSIDANQVLFTGGTVSMKGAVLDTNVQATLASDATATLPAGTVIHNVGFDQVLSSAATVIIPKGTPLTALAGLGLSVGSGPDGTSVVKSGGQITAGAAVATEIPVGRYTFPNGFYVVSDRGGTDAAPAGVYGLSAGSVQLSPGSTLSLSADASVTRRSFFAGGVELTGSTGIFAAGQANVFDTGASNLSLVTPLLGDRAVTGLSNESAYDMTLRTAGDLSVSRGGSAAVAAASTAGVPGSSVTLDGRHVDVSATTIRATAGTVALQASEGISLGDGATLEAPGFTKTFGDAADPQLRSAAGGAVTLTTANGDIALGDATLSVAGGKGNSGTLTLSASNGAIDLSQAHLDGNGTNGGTLVYASGGGVDADALNRLANSAGFTGGFDVTVAKGDLTLAAGETLRSSSVSLTANGGSVDIAGTIDTSGINGGGISLYGRDSVVLEGTAVLRARANGYGPLDTRQAKGGDVVLGTDFISSTTNADGSMTGTSGVVMVKSGAIIDVSAVNPDNRLVPLTYNMTTFFQPVLGDMDGTLSFRAPVVLDAASRPTVNVDVASSGSVVGARSVTLEGFERWDLQAVARSGKYVGVTCSTAACSGADATVTLDLRPGLDTAALDGTRTVVAGINFLGDNGGSSASTVADFVQNFDLSAGSAYGRLGGLASEANFHAAPGVDLFASGGIVLASNWNLGAGTVNLAAAKNAGDVTINPLLQTAADPTSGYVVTPGREADVFQNYTTMIYRTGGRPNGEAPLVSLRAGGNMTLQGSLSDGTFLYRDQTDPTYLARTQVQDFGYLATTAGFYFGGAGSRLTNFATWDGQDYFGGSDNYLTLALFGSASGQLITRQDSKTVDQNQAPYSAAGNSPAALSSTPGASGDPIGSAVVFPLLAGGKAAMSSSYRLIAGASAADAAALSVNPSQVDPASNATLSVTGLSSYTYNSSEYTTLLNPSLYVDTSYDPSFGIGGIFTQPSDGKATLSNWLTGATRAPQYRDGALAIIYLDDGSGDAPNRGLVSAAFTQFANERGLQAGTDYRFSMAQDGSGDTTTLATTQYIALSGKNFEAFVQSYLVPLSTQLANNLFKSPSSGGFVQGTTVPVQPSIRTGTGSIALAASTNVDLRGSSDPVYFDPGLGQTAQPTGATSQLGGVAVYTLGRRADPSVGTQAFVDPVTKATIMVDLSAGFDAIDGSTSFSNPTTGGGPTDLVGSLVYDPVLLTGGGDVHVAAGLDVQGRFSAYFNNNPNTSNAHPWDATAGTNVTITSPDGTVLSIPRAGIDPQLFREGIGTLGGGNIQVDAGRDVSDLTFAIDGATVYGTAMRGGGGTTAAALRYGGGDLAVVAGRDIVGGRLDLASGRAVLTAGGSFIAASYTALGPDANVSSDIPLDIAVNDATVGLLARGAVTIANVQALGGSTITIRGPSQALPTLLTIGTYSPAAGLGIVANSDVSITDRSYFDPVTGLIKFSPIYPGSLSIDALDGSIDLPSLLMNASADGQLQLFAGWDVNPAAIAMLDNVNIPGTAFPAVLPSATSTYLANLHSADPTHRNDPTPAYIFAGRDIDQMTLSMPKQTRVWAGRDIVDMMFFGQNLATSDVTRIVAGRDITATTRVITPEANPGTPIANASPEPSLQGNTFVIGGPGTFMLEAGRDIGPFLNSAVSRETVGNGNQPRIDTFFGGVIAVGNLWNPYLPAQSADIDMLVGVAKGADFAALRDAYVAPGTAANIAGDYGSKLVAWMQGTQADLLKSEFGSTSVTPDQAYAVFLKLSDLQQRRFLIGDVYFGELAATTQTSPAVYQRGYEAVNTLFPAALGYTSNSLGGGSNGAQSTVATGDLDLRLATVQTQQGGAVSILAPGGNIFAGSVVATAVQAARHTYQGYNLYSAAPVDYNSTYLPFFDRTADPTIGNGQILSIPQGGEGILTLRGGAINTFTDKSVLVNQSRLFTEGGGDIVMWSSNGDLNAGQGPKTSANFPPIVVNIDDHGHTTIDQSGSVTGAGIAALASTPDAPPSNVDLIAPRGTVDAGDAGVRVSGNLSVAALTIVNADNFQVSGASVGVPTVTVPSLSLSSVGNAAAAATKSVESPSNSATPAAASIIIVEFLGYGGGDDLPATAPPSDVDELKKRRK